jgi:hypothetical protein
MRLFQQLGTGIELNLPYIGMVSEAMTLNLTLVWLAAGKSRKRFDRPNFQESP